MEELKLNYLIRNSVNWLNHEFISYDEPVINDLELTEEEEEVDENDDDTEGRYTLFEMAYNQCIKKPAPKQGPKRSHMAHKSLGS